MIRGKTAAAIAVAAAIVAVCVVGSAWIVQSRDAWLVKSVVDRIAPWSAPAVLYAETPDAQSYFQVYDDATGAYENYVYEVQAHDAEGNERRVVLVSFGTMLDETEPFLAMVAKGSSIQTWEYAESLECLPVSDSAGGA